MNRKLLFAGMLVLVLAATGYYITRIMSQPTVSVPETLPPAPLAEATTPPAVPTDPSAVAPDQFAIAAPPQPEVVSNGMATDVTVPAMPTTDPNVDAALMTGEPAPVPAADVTVPLEAPAPLSETALPTDLAAAPDSVPAPVPSVPATSPVDPAIVAGLDQVSPPPPEEALAVARDVAPAEAAIVQNAPVLDTIAPPAEAAEQPKMGEPMPPAPPQPQTAGSENVGAAAGTLESAGTGPKVTEIISTPANIRPLPDSYLVVKKDRDGDDKKSRMTVARGALMQGRDQAALELFNALYDENPRDKKVLMGRAVALQRLGQEDAAIAAYEEVLRNDRKNVEALTNMLGLVRQQDPGLAVEKLQQLQEIYPSNADVAAQLGTVYGMMKRYDDALKYLEMADALKPGRGSILYNRAIVYDRMGRAADAAALYRDLVRMHADGSLDEPVPVEAIKRRLVSIR